MANDFIESLKTYGISDRIFCITTDCGNLSENFVANIDGWYSTNHNAYKLSNTWIFSIEDAISRSVKCIF